MVLLASAQPNAAAKPSPSGKIEAPEDRPSDPAELAAWYENKYLEALRENNINRTHIIMSLPQATKATISTRSS